MCTLLVCGKSLKDCNWHPSLWIAKCHEWKSKLAKCLQDEFVGGVSKLRTSVHGATAILLLQLTTEVATADEQQPEFHEIEAWVATEGHLRCHYSGHFVVRLLVRGYSHHHGTESKRWRQEEGTQLKIDYPLHFRFTTFIFTMKFS